MSWKNRMVKFTLHVRPYIFVKRNSRHVTLCCVKAIRHSCSAMERLSSRNLLDSDTPSHHRNTDIVSIKHTHTLTLPLSEQLTSHSGHDRVHQLNLWHTSRREYSCSLNALKKTVKVLCSEIRSAQR